MDLYSLLYNTHRRLVLLVQLYFQLSFFFTSWSGIMDRKRLLLVALLGILRIASQLQPLHARELGPFRRYKSLLVLHFQPGLRAASGSHSGVQDSPYMDSYERKVSVPVNGDHLSGVEDSPSMDSYDRKEYLPDNGDKDWIDNEEGEQEEEKRSHEPHPGDELLQILKADGTESYILSGY